MSIDFWARRPLSRNLTGAALVGALWISLQLLGNALAGERSPLLLDAVVRLAAVTIAILAVIGLYDRMPAAWGGLGAHRWTVREGGTGLLLGVGMASLASLPAYLLGSLLPGEGDAGYYLYWTAYIVVSASYEEMIFRGYLYQRLVEITGATAATLLASAGFAAAHLGKPELTPIALANLFLAGIFFSACWLRTGSLWLPIAAHAAWNLTLPMLFGLPVSGTDFGSGLGRVISSGPEWITGGAFGPEGGAAATLALLAGLYCVAGTSLVRYSPYTYATVFRAFARRRKPMERGAESS